jgi:hypothetical protein
MLGIFDSAIFDHSTFDTATNQLVAVQGTYTLAGQEVIIRHDWQLAGQTESYLINPGTSDLVHGYWIEPVTGTYQSIGYSALLYESSFFYIDNEIIYVPWSQSSIMVSGENRTVALLPTPVVEELVEYRTETAEPRLRVVS